MKSYGYKILARRKDGSLTIIRDLESQTQKEAASDARGNGYRVLKVFSLDTKDSEIDEWEYFNRK